MSTPAAATGSAACSLCGTPDLLGLGICASCSPGTRGDALLYLSRERTGRGEARLSDWLAERLGLSAGDPGVRDASRGLRPIVRLSPRGAPGAVSALAAAGVPSEAREIEKAWRRVPGGLLGLVGLVTLTGMWAGLTAWPLMLVVTPGFAGLMLLGAVRLARTPVWQPGRTAVLALPGRTAEQARRTVTELPDGEGRRLLHDIVVNGSALYEMASQSGDRAELGPTLERLLPLACDAARDLTHLDESLPLLDTGVAADADVLEQAREARQQLAGRLQDTRSALGRTRALQAGASLERANELLELARRLAEDTARHRDAARAIEALLAPS